MNFWEISCFESAPPPKNVVYFNPRWDSVQQEKEWRGERVDRDGEWHTCLRRRRRRNKKISSEGAQGFLNFFSQKNFSEKSKQWRLSVGDCTAPIPPATKEKKHSPRSLLRPFPELENVTKNDAVIHSCKECEEGKECMYVCFVWTGGGAL